MKLLPKKVANHTNDKFWRDIKTINNSKVPLPTNTNGNSGEESIVNMWKQHFRDLFNCVNNSSAKNLAFDVNYESTIKVLPEKVKDAIRNIDCSKSCGLDGVYAEHIKYCSERILPLLSTCFTGLLVPFVFVFS